MAVSSVSSALATQATTENTTTTESDSAVTSDFETFLQMLTVQMTNQDPLNPVESTDFAVQLAAFSQVEQQVLTNQYLEQLTSTTETSSLGTQAQMIGRSVQTTAAVTYDGGTIDLSPTYTEDADSHELVIRDADGSEVGRLTLTSEASNIEWSGETDSGTLDAGTYSFAVASYTDDELVGTSTVSAWGTVEELDFSEDDTLITLASGAQIYESEVTALR